MRKLLLLAVALVFAAGASAQTVAEKYAQKRQVAKADATETWKDLGEGTYSDIVISNINRGFSNNPVKVLVQESEQTPGRYRVVNPWPSVITHPEDNYLIVDATDPDYVMIEDQRCPLDDEENGETRYCSYTYFMHIIKGLPKTALQNANPQMVPTLKDGVIKFYNNSIAVMWPTCNNGIVADGEWTYTNMEYSGYLALPGSSAEEEWTSLGKGRMLEGIFHDFFDDNNPEETDVEIFESKATPGIYRIKDAFTFQSPKTARDLVIDATDPNFCRIKKQNTGIQTVDYGWTYVFSVSENGYFADYDDMVAQHPEWASRNITKDDKGIYIPKTSVLIFWPEYDEVNVVNNQFSIDSYIHFPGTDGVENVEAADNARTEYYTLQGIRVNTPQKGEIVIARRGSKTTKMLMR